MDIKNNMLADKGNKADFGDEDDSSFFLAQGSSRLGDDITLDHHSTVNENSIIVVSKQLEEVKISRDCLKAKYKELKKSLEDLKDQKTLADLQLAKKVGKNWCFC